MAHQLSWIKSWNHLEVAQCLLKKTKFEHQHSVVEPTRQMSWWESKTFVKRLYCMSELVVKTLLRSLYKVKVRVFANYYKTNSLLGHDSYFCSQRVKQLWILSDLLTLVRPHFRESGQPMLENFKSVGNYFIVIIPLLIQQNVWMIILIFLFLFWLLYLLIPVQRCSHFVDFLFF